MSNCVIGSWYTMLTVTLLLLLIIPDGWAQQPPLQQGRVPVCIIRSMTVLQIKTIPKQCIGSPENIVFKDSNLQEFPNNIFTSYRHLKTLDLSLTTIRKIDKNIFEAATKLLTLKLNHNNVEKLFSYMFKGAGSLKELEFTDSAILHIEEHAFNYLSSLELLDLSNNRINKLSDGIFDPLVSLLEIRLDRNQIQILDNKIFHKNKMLKTIHMAANELLQIDEETFQNTQLQYLDIHDNSALRVLNLNVNSILKVEGILITNCGLTELIIPPHAREVSANKNKIKLIHLSHDPADPTQLSPLKDLNLDENEISNMEQFNVFHNLEELELGDNQLNLFRPSALSTLKKLRQLGLARNRIPLDFTAHEVMSTFPQLEELIMSDIDWDKLAGKVLKEQLLKRDIQLIIDSNTKPPTLPPLPTIIATTTVATAVTNSNVFPEDTTTGNGHSYELNDQQRQMKEISMKYGALERDFFQLKSLSDEKMDALDKRISSLDFWIITVIVILSTIILLIIGSSCWYYGVLSKIRSRAQDGRDVNESRRSRAQLLQNMNSANNENGQEEDET